MSAAETFNTNLIALKAERERLNKIINDLETLEKQAITGEIDINFAHCGDVGRITNALSEINNIFDR